MQYNYSLRFFTIKLLDISYTTSELKHNTMKDLIRRIKKQLNNNWPVSKEDIQTMVNYIESQLKED